MMSNNKLSFVMNCLFNLLIEQGQVAALTVTHFSTELTLTYDLCPEAQVILESSPKVFFSLRLI